MYSANIRHVLNGSSWSLYGVRIMYPGKKPRPTENEETLLRRASVITAGVSFVHAALFDDMLVRCSEIIFLAKLLNLNAFDQPDVEEYKIKIKKFL